MILVGGAALTPPDRKSVVPFLTLGFNAISSPPSVDRLEAAWGVEDCLMIAGNFFAPLEHVEATEVALGAGARGSARPRPSGRPHLPTNDPLDNGSRSPRKLLRSLVARLLGRKS